MDYSKYSNSLGDRFCYFIPAGVTQITYCSGSKQVNTYIFEIGTKEEKEVCFIPRHGRSHDIMPSKINYKANIYGAFKLGADFILATNAVGSLDMNINPGTIAVPDQIIDFTHGRASTFFDGSDFGLTTRSGNELNGVVHTDVTQPFDQSIRAKILETGAHDVGR